MTEELIPAAGGAARRDDRRSPPPGGGAAFGFSGDLRLPAAADNATVMIE
jgi:hypothetical protein